MGYADGLVLVSETREGLQTLMTAVADWVERWGMTLNAKPGKTETMLVEAEQRRRRG